MTIGLYLLFAAFLAWLGGIQRRVIRPRAAAILVLLPLVFAAGPLARGAVLVPADITFSFPPQRSAWEEYGVERVSAPNFSDIAVQLIPWQEAVRFALRHGEAPLWNPFILAGDVLATSMQPAPAYPLHLLGLLLPLADAVGFVLLATLFLAAFGMYLLARGLLRCGELAALFGAIAYALSSYVFFWSHWNVGYMASLAPWVLLAVRRLAARPAAGTFWAGAAAATVLLTAGHPESVLVLAIPAAVLFVASVEWRDRRQWRRALGLGAAAALVALGLTAPLYLPFVEALPQSYEHEFRKTELYRSVVGALPLAVAADRMSASFLPYTRGVFGLEIPAKARGGFSGDEATGYAGTVALAFAVAGALVRRRARGFLLALALGGLLLACRMPGLIQAVQALPLFDVLIFDYFYLWAALGGCSLAALGFDAWIGGASQERRPAFGITASALLLLAVATAPGLRAEGLSRAFLLERGALAVVPLLLLVALDAWRRRPRFAAEAAIALLLVQRVLEAGHQFPAVPREQFYPPVAPIDRAIELAGGARVTALDEAMVPNSSAMFGLRDVRGYNALSLRRWRETTPLWAKPGQTIFDRVRDVEAPLLSFLNVAYVLAPASTEVPADWEVVAEANGTRLLRNPRPGRGIYVPGEVREGGSAAERLAEMAGERDFGARAWIDDGSSTRPLRTAANGPGEAVARAVGTGFEIRTTLAADAWVVVPVTHWKGWRAFDGERELPVAFANHAFVGVRAPAGERTLRLVYRPRSWIRGLRLAGATAAICAAIVLGTAVRRRARRAGP